VEILWVFFLLSFKYIINSYVISDSGDFAYGVKCQKGSAGAVLKVTQPLWNKLSCS